MFKTAIKVISKIYAANIKNKKKSGENKYDAPSILANLEIFFVFIFFHLFFLNKIIAHSVINKQRIIISFIFLIIGNRSALRALE